MADKIEVMFVRDKETKNAVKFEEVVAADRQRGVVGSLYVLKYDLNELGNPARLKVTVEVAE